MKEQDNKHQEDSKGKVEQAIGTGRGDQDATPDRGLTDMDSTVRRKHSTGTGSGISTKTSVTGSDFDGQVVDQ